VENLTTDPQVDGHPLIKESPLRAVSRILEIIGEDTSREGLLDTPKRVIKSFNTLYGGYKMDPADILKTTFAGEGYDEIVLLSNIEMYSTCEHHMLPFFGKAHVAYIPDKKVVGLSKLARLVECFSRRLQIQERLTTQVAESLEANLKPKAVAVIIEAKHFCMVARGVEKQNSIMTTSCMKGLFKEENKARAELLRLIKGGGAL
jgi:GTP cyclohydrolase IA